MVTSSWHSVWDEVPGQLVAPVGGVGPDQHRAGQGGRPHPEHVLGDVVQQQGDVERPRSPERGQDGGPGGLGLDHLVVRPGAVDEQQARPVVADPLADQLVDGLHRFPLVAGRGARRWTCRRQATVGPIAHLGGELGTNLEHVAIYQACVLP